MMHIRGETHFIPVSGANTQLMELCLKASQGPRRVSILQNGTLPLKEYFYFMLFTLEMHSYIFICREKQRQHVSSSLCQAVRYTRESGLCTSVLLRFACDGNTACACPQHPTRPAIVTLVFIPPKKFQGFIRRREELGHRGSEPSERCCAGEGDRAEEKPSVQTNRNDLQVRVTRVNTDAGNIQSFSQL